MSIPLHRETGKSFSKPFRTKAAQLAILFGIALTPFSSFAENTKCPEKMSAKSCELLKNIQNNPNLGEFTLPDFTPPKPSPKPKPPKNNSSKNITLDTQIIVGNQTGTKIRAEIPRYFINFDTSNRESDITLQNENGVEISGTFHDKFNTFIIGMTHKIFDIETSAGIYSEKHEIESTFNDQTQSESKTFFGLHFGAKFIQKISEKWQITFHGSSKLQLGPIYPKDPAAGIDGEFNYSKNITFGGGIALQNTQTKGPGNLNDGTDSRTEKPGLLAKISIIFHF